MEKNINIEQQRKEREQKLRKGERALRILEILAQGTAATFALMMAFAPGITYSMVQGMKKAPKEINDFFNDERKKNKFYSLLSYLQKTGLITKERGGIKTKWRLTDKGREKSKELKRRISNAKTPLLFIPDYQAEKSDKLVVIIFDIPEKEKFKQNWFRRVLKNLGLSLIQKSVWMGYIKIPTELIKDIKKLNLLPYIKIFSVIEIGNLD